MIRSPSAMKSSESSAEAARTSRDARRYFLSYSDAISEIAKHAEKENPHENPGISVKLSALHPRYEYTQVDRILRELVPRVLELAEHARRSDIAMTVDAEEADRLELSLQVFERVFRDERLTGYDGLGLAVQTYQRRASDVFRYLERLARDAGRRIPVRLVKGAYWDTEIKHAQELGLESYPVFTRKVHTDVSYLACARLALAAGEALYPQFATHNAHTLASVLHYAGSRRDYEFQRLHGMGESLHDLVLKEAGTRCRIYAPVGAHRDLLAYLKLVANLSRDYVIMKLDFRVRYDADVEKIRKIIKKKVYQPIMDDPELGPKLLEPIKSQGVREMDDSAMIMRVKYKTKPGDQFAIRKEVYRLMQEAFKEEGIEFAHRNVTVYMPPETGSEAAAQTAGEVQQEDAKPDSNVQRQAAAALALIQAEEEEMAKQKPEK